MPRIVLEMIGGVWNHRHDDVGAMASCSGEADDPVIEPRPAALTLITSTGGMGDNGYNDLILDGIMGFVTKNNVALSIVSPKDRQEAQTAVKNWHNDNTTGNKSLLILASNEYESLLDGNLLKPEASKSVLLFESEKEDLPDNVFTFSIRRYGASYLCGRMAAKYRVRACRLSGDGTLEPAIEGFRQSYAEGLNQAAG